MSADPTVEITQEGRGGRVLYREGDHTIDFGWEFAVAPATAIVLGREARYWDAAYPWARGRVDAIYRFVGAEVVRQHVPGGRFVVDTDAGIIDIIPP